MFLWLDEIEKGVAAGDDDDGLSRRGPSDPFLPGCLRKRNLFSSSRPRTISCDFPGNGPQRSLLMKIFFVDLPNAENRKDIFAIHLRKRRLSPAEFGLEELSRVSEGFSGSEIEQAIVSGIYTAHLGLAARCLKPTFWLKMQPQASLPVLMKERIEAIRDWASERTVPCT